MAGRNITHILVAGGGTAGWLTACHLAKKLGSDHPDGVRVTLVESPDIPPIGVGEGTVPAIRESLKYLGLRETDFIRECDVTFKQSIRFDDWLYAPGGAAHNSYHHVFDYPAASDVDLAAYWLMSKGDGRSFVDATSIQGRLCDRGLGPKLITHAEYDGMASYAYHLDAAKFSEFLARHATSCLGVTRLWANVTDITLDDTGAVASLSTDRHGILEADFFVDCTGFSSLIMEQKLGVGFVDKSDVLFVDHALAAQVPYAADDRAIPCQTIAAAQEAGWIWDIGLADRRGTGYVYSARHTSHADADAVFRTYLRKTLGPRAEDVTPRLIKMKIGYREKFWHKNCVAIGLSQGFVEPLEATGLLLFDATARMLADQIPAQREHMPLVADRFSGLVRNAWERVVDFVKLHYVLSRREDHAFWRDNRDPVSIPESLRNNLALWRHNLPGGYDFPSRFEIFNRENYLYILYGMRFETQLSDVAHCYPEPARAREMFAHIEHVADQLSGRLLPHRELIEKSNNSACRRYSPQEERDERDDAKGDDDCRRRFRGLDDGDLSQ